MPDQRKPFVYVASPYTNGDPAINTHFQCRIFNEMMDDGIVWPYIPLLSHFQHTIFPRQYQDWTDWDNAAIDHFGFDACLRLNATHEDWYLEEQSSGADAEVKRFEAMDIPVFYTRSVLYAWATKQARRESA